MQKSWTHVKVSHFHTEVGAEVQAMQSTYLPSPVLHLLRHFFPRHKNWYRVPSRSHNQLQLGSTQCLSIRSLSFLFSFFSVSPPSSSGFNFFQQTDIVHVPGAKYLPIQIACVLYTADSGMPSTVYQLQCFSNYRYYHTLRNHPQSMSTNYLFFLQKSLTALTKQFI